MTASSSLHALEQVATLRERAVERLASAMAQKAAERNRYRRNLERLAAMSAASSSEPSGSDPAPPHGVHRSVNAALHKQVVLRLAETHRTDLALHEADMAVTQGALVQAIGRREAIGQVLAARLRRLAHDEQRRSRRREDEVAAQWWLRSSE